MYGKVFSSLWHGSMLGQPDGQLVFVLLIAHSDRNGNSEAHPAEIATWTGLPQERVDAALEMLQAADTDSSSEEEGGKRVIRVGLNLWKIVNYRKYLEMQDRDAVRAQTNERVRRHREVKRSVTVGNGPKRQGEVEREGEKDTPLVPEGTAWTRLFAEAWVKYPHWGRRSSKQESRRRWNAVPIPERLQPAALLAALEACAQSPDWTKSGGEFVPAMEVWIRERGWDTSEGASLTPTDDPVERMRRKMKAANGQARPS